MKRCPNCKEEMNEVLIEIGLCSECGEEVDPDQPDKLKKMRTKTMKVKAKYPSGSIKRFDGEWLGFARFAGKLIINAQ